VRSVHGSRSLRDSVARGQNSDNDAQLVESYAAAANSRGSNLGSVVGRYDGRRPNASAN